MKYVIHAYIKLEYNPRKAQDNFIYHAKQNAKSIKCQMGFFFGKN